MLFSSTFETRQGCGVVIATEQGVCNVLLPHVGHAAMPGNSHYDPSALTVQVARMLESYFKGQKQSFEEIPVDLSLLTPFRARILMLIRAIPHGETRSYGQVAAMAGSPHGARAVGGAMASNPVPVIIPCHRVVAADGSLTGFTAPGGLTAKKNLLQTEGIEFKGEHILFKIGGYKQV